MAEIIKMNTDTLTISELLERSCDLKGCLVLGINPDNTLFFGMANLSAMEIVYMLEKCKHLVMNMED